MSNAHTNIQNLKAYIQKVNVVFEIGAHDGRDIQQINELWDMPIIHCFEPDPEPFEKLKTYASENILVNNVGLFHTTGMFTLYKIYDKNINEVLDNKDLEAQKERLDFYKTAQSLYPINTDYHRYDNTGRILMRPVEVPVITIDDYCNKINVVPDILLIDTQGSEYDILKGASNILQNSQVKGILLEWSEEDLYVNQPKFTAMKDYLAGFSFILKEKINLWSDVHGDAVFIRE